MASLRVSDSQLGLLVACAVGLALYWVLVVIDQHVKQHRHCPAYSMHRVERAERNQVEGGRVGQDVVHGCSVPQSRASHHVRSASP